MDLRRELVAVAVLGSAFAEGCGGSSTTPDNCPRTVVDKEAKVSLSSADACALGQKTQQSQGGPYAPLADCQAACNDPSINTCSLPYDYLQAVWTAQRAADGGAVQCPAPEGGSTVTLVCQVTHQEGVFGPGCAVPGRRPEGLVPVSPARSADAYAEWLADSAHLEAAAVLAFERMAEELASHGAPRELVERARAAAADEERHARVVGDLAARRGVTHQRAVALRVEPRALLDIAVENACEGVVRETFAAAVALHQARAAGDAALREAMERIADDECAHAALSWDVHAWLRERIGDEARAAVDAAKQGAIDDLARALATEPPAALTRHGGVPTARAAQAMLAQLRDRVWAAA